MGTPDFAVPVLNAIHAAGHDVAAVVTAPDRPAGRGMKMQASAVTLAAINLGLTVLQPTNLKSEEFLAQLETLNPDIAVVVAFRMLPVAVWSMPPLGTINLHASLLPAYRGAAPINWAIINGETQTGLTTFRLRHEIDTGDILLQHPVSIADNETFGELYNRMSALGAPLMVETLSRIEEGTAVAKPQDMKGDYPRAPKLSNDNRKIDWTKSAEAVRNHIRGLSPSPGAWTQWNGKILKIYSARIGSPDEKIPMIAAADGWIVPIEVQLEGKARMDWAAFSAGQRLADGGQLAL